ncbi:OmpA family protein [Flavobacterium sp. ACAM 123]|jgi:outer membrane protein OmpA-like peptidoglycan-associated protein|uniref:OmpA family protein n=1 Tax=Flavobacterium sp. ACAM 123 TaxID=1189620 RepID=UPI0002F22D22|nr:OmpA family protein [Flavobacterium sp. ACAM 123]
MLGYFKIIALLFFGYLNAQTEKVQTVYFDFDKYGLDSQQEQSILKFIRKVDTATIESIQIYGYCDDRGNADYNYKLSEQRVGTVRNILTSHGFNKNKIVIIEGKGRVIITDDVIENWSEIRSKNRRVDLVLVRKNSFGAGIYNSFQDQHTAGDRIYLEKIYFPFGSSTLNSQSRQELDKIAKILNSNKNLEFEIIGHVCCTPSYYTDAIDRATNERKLSVNRAKSVFLYLMKKNINSLRMSYKGVGNKFPLGKGEEFDRRVEFLITKT